MTSASTSIRRADENDLPAILSLLADSSLPLDGASDHLSGFLVARRNGQLVACGAVEKYGKEALLRSLAVADKQRSSGVGSELVRALIDRARREGIETIVLLTTTAADYFPRFGFRRIGRDETPESVRASQEFGSACPDTATVMCLSLGGL